MRARRKAPVKVGVEALSKVSYIMETFDLFLVFTVNLVLSRALLYTQANLKSSVDTLKAKKQQEELPEEGSEESENKPEG